MGPTTANPLSELVAPDWAVALEPVEEKISEAGQFLRAEIAAGRGYLPAGENVLRAFGRPLADVRVRRAINMAIDRQAIWDATMEGTGEIAWLPVPSQHWAYSEDLVPSFEYDPEAAKALLEEAGYGDGFTLTMTSAAQADFVRRAEIMQAQLGAIGIQVEVVPEATTDSVDLDDLGAGFGAAGGGEDLDSSAVDAGAERSAAMHAEADREPQDGTRLVDEQPEDHRPTT